MVIVSGEAAAQISTIRAYPIHRYVTYLLTPFIGANNIATSNGNLWKKLHHILAPAFVPRYTKTLLASMVDEALIFHERLKQLADKDVFSLEEELSKVLFDIIGKIVFGFPLHAQASGSPVLTDLKWLLDSFPLTFRTLNPVKKFWVGRKQNVVAKRIDEYIGDRAKERYAILRDEKEREMSQKASSVLDRVLLEKVESSSISGLEELDSEYLQLIADKYEIEICLVISS